MRSELLLDSDIGLATLIYFQERLRYRLFDLISREFATYRANGRTKAQLAKRLGKRPEQITRWLSGPANLTLDTLSDLLLGLSGAELSASVDHPGDRPKGPVRLPEKLVLANASAKEKEQKLPYAPNTYLVNAKIDPDVVNIVQPLALSVQAFAKVI